MGCDIHTTVQKKDKDGAWQTLEFTVFDNRRYSVFGFLANVRNYSAVPSIAAGRGFPADADWDTDWDEHSHTWVAVSELLTFEYDRVVEDRRCQNMSTIGHASVAPGLGIITTYREFLGPSYFDDLVRLEQSGADRVLMCFDS